MKHCRLVKKQIEKLVENYKLEMKKKTNEF